MNRNISVKEVLRMMKEYFDSHTDDWLRNRMEEEKQRIANIVHPYCPDVKTDKSLKEILKPTIVDCNVNEVLKWDGLNE